MTVCTKCLMNKADSEFSFEKRKNRPRKICRECVKAYNRGYQEANRKEVKEQRDRYRFENSKKLVEAQRVYEVKNSEKVRGYQRTYHSAHRDKKSEYDKDLRRENPERRFAYESARRARKKNAVPKWETNVVLSETQWRRGLNLGMTLDHIVPITPPMTTTLGGRPLSPANRTFVGPLIPIVHGLHTEANWQPLTRSENSRKQNRDWPNSPWS